MIFDLNYANKHFIFLTSQEVIMNYTGEYDHSQTT